MLRPSAKEPQKRHRAASRRAVICFDGAVVYQRPRPCGRADGFLLISQLAEDAARLGLLILLPHPVLRLLAATLEPVEHLGGRVDLVVVLAFRKNRTLVQVFGEPARLFGQMDKAVSNIAVCACMRMILSVCGW